jgi:hypothetical protein
VKIFCKQGKRLAVPTKPSDVGEGGIGDLDAENKRLVARRIPDLARLSGGGNRLRPTASSADGPELTVTLLRWLRGREGRHFVRRVQPGCFEQV